MIHGPLNIVSKAYTCTWRENWNLPISKLSVYNFWK